MAEQKKQAATLFSAAEKHLKAGQAKECVKAAGDALDIFRSLGKECESALADTLRLVIEGKRQVYAQTKQDPKELKRFAEDELAKFEKAGDKRGEAAMLISIAEIALDLRKRPAQAEIPSLQPVEKALQILRDMGDKRLEGMALIAMSETYLVRPALVEAKSAAEAAMPLFEDLGDRLNKAKALRNLARSQLAGGKIAAGEKMSQAAIEIFREENARRLEADEMLSLSEYLLNGGKPKSALCAAEQGLAIFKYLGCEKAEEISALIKVSDCLLALNKGRTAAMRGREAAKRFSAEGDHASEAMALQIVCAAQLQLGKKKDSLQAAQEAQEVLRDLDDGSLKAHALKDEAAALAALDDYEEASRRLYDAQAQASKVGNLGLQAAILRCTAQMHIDRGNYKEGLSAARDAVETSERHGDKRSMAKALESVGMAQGILGNLQQAVISAQECQDLYQEIGDPLGEEIALELMAKLRAAEGKIDTALEAGEERLAVVREQGNMAKEADALHQVAGLHFQSGNIAVAERTIKDAKALAKKAGNSATLAEILVTLAHIYLERADMVGEGGERFLLELASRAGADAAAAAGQARIHRTWAQALLFRGRAMFRMNRLNDAWRSGADSAHKYQAIGDGPGMCKALLLCGEIQIERNEVSQAKEILEQAQDIAQKCEEKEMEAKAEALLQRLKPKQASVAQVAQQIEDDSPKEAAPAAAAPTAVASAAPEKPKGLDPVLVRKQVMNFVKDAIADDGELEVDSPFMEAGMDSLSSVSLTSMLAKEFGMALSPSLVFDFPTVRALEAHLVEESMNQ